MRARAQGYKTTLEARIYPVTLAFTYRAGKISAT